MYKLRAPFLLAIIAISCGTPAAQAACEQWDVSGNWQLRQSNLKTVVYFNNVQQNGSNILGDAQFAYDSENKGKFVAHGSFTGTLQGNKLNMIVKWDLQGNYRQKGIYKGKIGSSGKLSGTTFDALNLNSSASFSRKKAFKCMDVAVEEPSGPPPLELGKVPIPEVVLDDPLDICGYARSARKRGSPAAPGLERQCREAGGVP